MPQILSEQLMNERDELFFTILDQFIDENFEVDQDYVMTEEDAYVVSILYDYFTENFYYPTAEESLLEDVSSYDLNTKLYDELAEVLLDESIGTFVAGARHGIQSFLAKRAETKAQTAADRAKQASKGASSAATAAAKQHKASEKSGVYGSGITGAFKKGMASGKVEKLQTRAKAAKSSFEKAQARNVDAKNKAYDVNKKREGLANKIDTGISNIKNRVKSAITTGAQRVGGILGKAMG